MAKRCEDPLGQGQRVQLAVGILSERHEGPEMEPQIGSLEGDLSASLDEGPDLAVGQVP